MEQLLLLSLAGGLFSLAGGLFLIWQSKLAKKIITPLLSFAAGAFLATSVLDLMPEAIELVEEPHDAFKIVLAGFLTFFAFERFLMCYVLNREHNQHSEHTESLPILMILGDSLHNFIDGIVIALAFVVNPAVGVATTLAVAAHEIPQEIGDFTVLLDQGWDKKKIIAVNILQSLATIPGALLGFFAAQIFQTNLATMLAFTAGIFLYVGASSLIPEVHHRSGHKLFFQAIVPLVVAIISVSLLVNLTH